MGRIIQAKELRAKKTVALARWLLGKFLVRRRGRSIAAQLITEVEAYDGERDLACHARVGRTPRTEVMYGPGGVWYVYLCYGVHEMLNLVVGPRDWPAAILIRGVEDVSGPGRVTKMHGIDRKLNRASAVARASGLWLEDRGVRVPRRIARATPRIGVDYAGPVWAKKRWRFVITDVGRLTRRRRGANTDERRLQDRRPTKTQRESPALRPAKANPSPGRA
jgi:DNA-3-methyladenine glycosylase